MQFSISRSQTLFGNAFSDALRHCFLYDAERLGRHSQTEFGNEKIGKPSKGPTHNAIYRLQGSPIRHPLEGKIITIAIITGTEYAKALGKKHLVLVEPLEHLVKIYQRHGFTFKTSKHYPRRYCIKEV